MACIHEGGTEKCVRNPSGSCKVQQRLYYAKNSKRIRAYWRGHLSTDAGLAVNMVCNARKRAKEQGTECSVTPEFIAYQLPKGCPVFGWGFVRRVGGGQGKLSPTLDQFEPRGGYTDDNCWVISNHANNIKNNATPLEVLQVAVWMYIVSHFGRTLTQKQFEKLRDKLTAKTTKQILAMIEAQRAAL